ncbi:MAG: BT_3928 family protein [Candidatus Dadabacteria bacterium]
MRLLTRIVQILVGLLFIFSGIIKANDPLGLSYKMQEFFELWSAGLLQGHFFLRTPLVSLLDFLHDHSLTLSIIMITLEIIAGVAVIIGWSRNFILYLLLVLIIFFTFLTGYAYLSGKFTNCGCFGDCLPITPLTSFTKDVILLFLILLLLAGRRYIMRPITARAGNFIIIFILFVCLFAQWYMLTYLPVLDCLPFKKGNVIAEQMHPPKGSVPDSFAIRFIYEKNGVRYQFSPENLPADFTTYKYIDRQQTLVRKGNAEPAIKGFVLTGISGEDSTETILQLPECLLLFCLDFSKTNWLPSFKQVVSEAGKKNVPVFVASPSLVDGKKMFDKEGLAEVPQFNTDYTVVRTVARTNPTLLLLKKGVIINKYPAIKLKDAIRNL